MRYHDFGGSGTNMLLVHGLGGSCENWFAVAPRLAQRFRVVALDLAGFGYTPVNPERQATLEANRALAEAFTTSVFQDAVVVVGHSMGALIAMLHARRRPDQVAGLVLVDPVVPYEAGTGDPAAEAMMRMWRTPHAEATMRGMLAQVGHEQAMRMTLAEGCVNVHRIPHEVIDAHIELAAARAMMEWAVPAGIEAARSVLDLKDDELSYFQLVRAIAPPTLLIHGKHDRSFPIAAAERVAAARPDWRFHIIEHAGHSPHLEAADEVAGVVLEWARESLGLTLGER